MAPVDTRPVGRPFSGETVTEHLLLIAIAAAGGIAVAVQAQFMGVMDQGIGTLESVFITYMGGAVLILLATAALKGGNLSGWQAVPRYTLAAGLFGLVIVGAIGYSVPRLGMVPAFTVLVAAQFFFGALIDHFGWFGATVRPLEASQWAGIPVLLVGIWLILR